MDERLGVPLARYLNQPNQGLDRFALAEVVAKRRREPRHFVILFKPVCKQALRDLGSAGVAAFPPSIDDGTNLRHQQEIAGAAAGILLAPTRVRFLILNQVAGRLLPRQAAGNLWQVLIVGDDGARHGYFTATSNNWEVSLPKMSITFTKARYLPAFG